MSRKIKAKSFDEEKGVFVRAKLIENESSNWIDERGFTVVWSTGLQDKNGEDIYENDLLRFLHDYKDYPVKQVIWNNNHLSYSLLSKQEEEWVNAGSNHFKYWYTDEDNLYFLQEVESYEIEVIGSIHENPELIWGTELWNGTIH